MLEIMPQNSVEKPAAAVPALAIHKLDAHIQTRQILHGIDFSLAPGAVLGLVGPNGSGKSYWDTTNIVICSEMSRSIYGSTGSISGDINAIMDQDVCTHWDTSSVAFLGGNVKGGTQFGKVGVTTLDSIPMMPDGSLDPAYNPQTGALQGTKSPQSYISDAGHVYSTALALSGINPAGIGLNTRPAMDFIKKP